jgi:serine/threonine protein kinase
VTAADSPTLQSPTLFHNYMWKLADFGLTSQGTSNRLVTTHFSRGKPGYRAPELLGISSTKPSYSNKSDIWSLGCLLYEFLVGQKPFPDDFAVREYALSAKTRTKVLSLIPTALGFDKVILPMLEVEPLKRPAAKEILVQILEELPFLPFSTDTLGRRTLQWAVRNLNADIIALWVRIHPEMVENGLIDVSLSHGQIHVLRALLGAEWAPKDVWKAIYAAISRTDADMVDVILQSGYSWECGEEDRDSWTLLRLAVERGDRRIVQKLLDAERLRVFEDNEPPKLEMEE